MERYNVTKDMTPRPLMGDELNLLHDNPNRGFRVEAYLEVSTGYAYPGQEKDALGALDELLDREYRTEKPGIVQAYFYLNGYQTRDLDKPAFDRMNRYLQHCRERQLRVLLRFAYIYDDRRWDELDAPTEQILRHITQLDVFLRQNRDVIYCLQAGYLGPWGEWSGGAKQDRLTVLDHLLNHIPEGLPVMVRYVWIKNVLPDADPRRGIVGYHDDYLVSDPHQWNSCAKPDTPYYPQMTAETPYLVVDGEMPWASDINKIDGIKMAKRLALHHFTSLSLEHNYHEDGGAYSLEEWKQIPVTPTLLQQEQLPYNPNWFLRACKQNGTTGEMKNPAQTDEISQECVQITRSLFEYIRDYLGYHIVMTDAHIRQVGEQLEITVTLINYGFAAPIAMQSCDFVLIDEAGEMIQTRTACRLAQLQPQCPVICQAFFPVVNDRRWQLGIRLADAAGRGARLANDMPIYNGIHLLGGRSDR